jgi:hypothetical protein
VVTEKDAHLSLSTQFETSPAKLWEWINDPNKRMLWQPENSWESKRDESGITMKGSKNHCAHGKGTIIEDILDWRPFDYYSAGMHPNGSKKAMVLMTMALSEDNNKTVLSTRFKLSLPLPKFIGSILIKKLVTNQLINNYQKLQGLIHQ